MFAVVALFGAGCDAEVRSVVRVGAGDTLEATAQVVLRGEAADVVRDDQTGLVDAVAESTGVDASMVKVHDDGSQLVAEVAVAAASLTEAAGLSGVAALEVVDPPDRSGGRAVVATLVHPHRLRDVVANAAADTGQGGTDTEAVIDAALGSVEMVLQVRFDGGTRDAWFNPAPNNQPGAAPLVSDTGEHAELRQSLARFSAGTFVVVGDPAAGGGPNRWIAAAVLATAAVVAAATYDRRRKSGAAAVAP